MISPACLSSAHVPNATDGHCHNDACSLLYPCQSAWQCWIVGSAISQVSGSLGDPNFRTPVARKHLVLMNPNIAK